MLQVCMEGAISKNSVSNAVDRGKRAAGDLLPWTISQQFMVIIKKFCCAE